MVIDVWAINLALQGAHEVKTAKGGKSTKGKKKVK